MNILRAASGRAGLIGVIVTVLVTGVGLSFSSVPMLFAQPTYYGEFSESGGLRSGDKVRVYGMDVGHVRSVELTRGKVVVGFTLGGHMIGTDSRLAIRTDTLLGRKDLEIDPRGASQLHPDGVIPVDQSTTPYQIYGAISDVTRATEGWNLDSVKQALNVLSENADQVSPHLSAALDGVARFSDTIGKRDEQLKRLLTNANQVTSVLGQNGGRIDALLSDTRSLVTAFNTKSQAVDQLLGRVSAVSTQIQGFIADNPNLNHVLEQLRTITSVLVTRQSELQDVLVTLSKFSTSLAEAVASGPYFKVMVVNLLPGNMLQPFVDAAFKKRGIDPEQFWRNTGLPAFQFPDPNGNSFPNGAPPAAPTPAEGTPDHPGPAVAPGSPCSYTPPADGLPTPAAPLPCAQLDQGPFGDVAGGFSPPNVNTAPPSVGVNDPGVPAAAVDGQPAPLVPGIAAPLPPAPPGARTEVSPPLPEPPLGRQEQGGA